MAKKKTQSEKKYYVLHSENGIVFESDDFNEACAFIEGQPLCMVFARKDKK